MIFNIFLNDLFYVIKHVKLNAYADDQQLYSSGTDHAALNERLNSELSVVVNWFGENGLMANPKKFQAMVLGTRKHDFCFKADNTVIDEYDNIDLLGINVDNHLKFEKHTSNICKRINKQLQVLKRFRNLVSSYHLTLNLVFITEGFRVTYFSSLFLCFFFVVLGV